MQSVAQTNWEGTAVVGRYGEFPPGGLYVASNTFPLNSMIDVTNLRTGESARLIVAKDLTDSGVFLLLSEAAADELGIRSGSSAVVRARPVQLPGLTAVDPNQDLPFHPDPDVNPAATLGDPNESIITPDALAPAEQARTDSIGETATQAPAATPRPSMVIEDPPEAADGQPRTVEESRSPAEAALAPDIASAVEPVVDEAPSEVAPSPPLAVESAPSPEAPVRGAVSDIDPVDERDMQDPSEVIGVNPPIAATDAGAPEASMPRTNPETIPPLAVQLSLPTDPVAVAEPHTTEEAEPTNVRDPLDERLSAIDRQLAMERVSADPVEVTPTDDDLDAPEPIRIAEDDRRLPTVDVDAALDSEVTDPFPTAPSDNGTIAELPPVEDRSTPDVASPPPAPPTLAEAEVDLPVASVAADEPPAIAADDGATAEADTLQPSLIPEDAIVTLEPAEYRSPEPPAPTADELSPDSAAPAADAVDVAIATPEIPSEDAVETVEPTPPVAAEPAPTTGSVAVVPDEVRPEVAGAADLSWARANLPLVADLDQGAAYIQVAAFTNARSVQRTVDSLGGGFPVAVVSQNINGGPVYRIFLGPLSEDEKGTALFTVRNRGFRDAFIRQES
ncbi:MAG: SPOR domain-containing protein [Spirochaetales bacterium]|nr:SPOR domain-containing protein [Spirochaetales bacterium]